MFFCSKFSGRLPEWQPITAQQEERVQKLSSLQKSESLSKKLTKLFFGLEMLADSGIVHANKLKDLLSEATQLVAIFTASRTTARS